jgi:hypothetical protein
MKLQFKIEILPVALNCRLYVGAGRKPTGYNRFVRYIVPLLKGPAGEVQNLIYWGAADPIFLLPG